MIPVVQWFKNGDHPQDNCRELTDSNGDLFWSEGEVVRHYRHPHFPGVQNCAHCGYTLHTHGWIDSGGDGQVVCPGDFIFHTPDSHPTAVRSRVAVMLNPKTQLQQWGVLDEHGRRMFASELILEKRGIPGIRATNYSEVAKLLGTSGCSKQHPYWDWSVMGAIDHARGTELVLPNDMVEVDAETGVALRVFLPQQPYPENTLSS